MTSAAQLRKQLKAIKELEALGESVEISRKDFRYSSKDKKYDLTIPDKDKRKSH